MDNAPQIIRPGGLRITPRAPLPGENLVLDFTAIVSTQGKCERILGLSGRFFETDTTLADLPEDVRSPLEQAIRSALLDRDWETGTFGGKSTRYVATAQLPLQLFAEFEGELTIPPTIVKEPKFYAPSPDDLLYLPGGRVKVQFLLDAEGRIGPIRIIESPHPVFSNVVIDHIRTVQWSPGRRGAVAVPFVVQQPFIFGSKDAQSFTLESRGRGPDVQAEVSLVLPPHLPRAAALQDYRGKSSVRFLSDTNGRVIATEAAEINLTSHEMALRAAVALWRCRPAVTQGNFIRTIVRYEHNFNSDGLSPGLRAILGRMRTKSPPEAVAEGDLDAPLRIYLNPGYWFERTATIVDPEIAQATPFKVNFFVDREGYPGLVEMETTASPQVQARLVNLIGNSRFAKPMKGGKPVAVQVERTLYLY